MGRKQNGTPLFRSELSKQRAHLGNTLRVETVHRLIEQQNLRLSEHRICNTETLSHTERKGAELGFYARKADELQYSPDFRRVSYALDPAVKAQILLCAQIRKKITADKEAYLLPSLTKPCLCRLSVNRDASALYFRESQNGFKKGCFSGAVFSDQTVNFTLSDCYVQAVQHRFFAVALADLPKFNPIHSLPLFCHLSFVRAAG